MQAHALGGADHAADLLANLNARVTDANLDDLGNTRPPAAHDLGGAAHNMDILADLNAKVSNATLASMQMICKQVVETVNNSIVFQDDDQLRVVLGAAEWWIFDIIAFFSTVAAADIKFRLHGTQAITLMGAHQALHGASGVFRAGEYVNALDDAINYDFGADVVGGYYHFFGAILNGAAINTLTLQWAQRVANAGDTSVLQGSYSLARRFDP